MNRRTALTLVSLALAGPQVRMGLATTLKVGDLAPDFTLPSTDGGSVTLSKLRGKKVVLAFFVAAFTGG